MDAPLVTAEAVAAGEDAGFNWAAWDRFVETCPGGTFYHRSGWLRAVACGLGHDIRLHVLREGGGFLAGTFVRRAVRLGIAAGRKPWGTGYNGIIAPRGTDSQAALHAELLRAYRQVRLVQAPAVEPACPLPAAWRAKTATTPVLDVRDLSKLWDSFDRHARQRVRKAAGLGITAGESTAFGDFADLYTLTYERQGLAMPLSAGRIEEVVRRAVASGDARLFVARMSSGEPAAGLLVGYLGRRAWFVLAASHPMHRKSDPVTFLWWHAMEQSAPVVSEIDLVGHGVGSIDRFKASFSPRLAEHRELEAYARGPVGWALRAVDRRRARIHNREIPA